MLNFKHGNYQPLYHESFTTHDCTILNEKVKIDLKFLRSQQISFKFDLSKGLIISFCTGLACWQEYVIGSLIVILISRLLPLSVTTYYMFTRLIHVVIHWFCMLGAVNFVMHTVLVTALEICDFTLCYVYSLGDLS